MRSHTITRALLCCVVAYAWAQKAPTRVREPEAAFRNLSAARDRGLEVARDIKAFIEEPETLKRAGLRYQSTADCFNSFNDSIRLALSQGRTKELGDTKALAECMTKFEDLRTFAKANIKQLRSPFVTAKEVVDLIKLGVEAFKDFQLKRKLKREELNKFFDAVKWPSWKDVVKV